MSTIESIANVNQDIFGYDLLNFYAGKLGFTEDQISTFDIVLESLEELLEKKARPNVLKWEKEGAKLTESGRVELPESLVNVITEIVKDNELCALFIPIEYGGYGYTQVFQAAVAEKFNIFDSNIHIPATISLSVIEALVEYYKPHYQPILDRFAKGEATGYVAFTEPNAGSHLENVASTSYLDGDEWVLNGTKIFISNGGFADIGLFLAKNIEDGKEKGTNVFVVDTVDGVICERIEEKSGLKANPTAQLHFKDVRVPKDNIISTVGNGYRNVLERLMGMRLGVSMQGVGNSIRAYQLAKAYAEERTQFGKPIISFDGVSRKINAMEKTIPRMRMYSYQAGYALDRYLKGYIPSEVGATGDASEKTAAKQIGDTVRVGLAHYFVSAAKLYNTEITQHIAFDAQQIFGGNGFVTEYEVNKIVRDVRVLNIYEGTSEIHEFLINRAQAAINMLPKFQRMSTLFDGTTMYEDLLYTRFPEMKGKI